MKDIKKSKSSTKKNAFIVIEILILVLLVVLTVVIIKGDEIFKDEEPSIYITTQGLSEGSVAGDGDYSFSNIWDPGYNQNGQTQSVPGVTNSNGSIPVTSNQNDNINMLPDPSGWSTAQIIATAKSAVDKTKGYSGALTVNHSEGFAANVTECSGGGIIRTIVDLMIGWVVKPVDETLVFQNGKAVNTEGETVPILLPKRGAFSLSESGVESATVQRVGNEYVIKINLIEEDCGMYDIPKHNASAIGYLDVASFDISFMEIDSANIVYKGSSIELKINEDGYVTYASYKIPLHIDGSAHKGSISGSASFEGEQTESWSFNY